MEECCLDIAVEMRKFEPYQLLDVPISWNFFFFFSRWVTNAVA